MTRPSYWMLADTEVPLAWDANRLESFAAYFKHALLFNEHLMLSDAQAVNCMNFRRLLNADSDFQQVLDKSLLSVAVRATDGHESGVPLTQVRDAFAKEGKQRSEVAEEFFRDDDLDRMMTSCNIRPYEYGQLREHYTNSVLEIFARESVARSMGDEVQTLLLALLNEESERNNGLGRIFLYDGIGKILEELGAGKTWQQQREKIVQLSDAPYVTGIPTVMSANPIYSPVHQASFELAYDTAAVKTEAVDDLKPLPLYSDLDLSSYEYALRKLKIEDVLKLRSSSEFRRFNKLTSSVVARPGQLDDVMRALEQYQQLIDRYIIDRHLGRKSRVTSGAGRIIKPLLKIGHEGGMFSLGLLLASPLDGGLLSLANFFAGTALDVRAERNGLQYGTEKRQLRHELKEAEQTDLISARVHARDNMETLYDSAC